MDIEDFLHYASEVYFNSGRVLVVCSDYDDAENAFDALTAYFGHDKVRIHFTSKDDAIKLYFIRELNSDVISTEPLEFNETDFQKFCFDVAQDSFFEVFWISLAGPRTPNLHHIVAQQKRLLNIVGYSADTGIAQPPSGLGTA